jgi:serine/threonine protein kinase
MSTFTSEPGTRLGGRYRLEDRLAAAGGWAAWKAIDEILARPVSVITFAAGFPRLEQVVTAARAASRLTDTRLTQVFDVEDSWDHAYIVLEWPVGDTLADLLSGGPMDPVAGARIVAEVAAALSGAHAAGLAHLCLRPESVRWTAGGGVKVTGLGIDAALSGIASDDPELADTRGIGQLLYAALTGLWPDPGDDDSELPPAPTQDGQPRRPRQVRAGVPAFLDDIACRALALPGRDGQAVFSAPSQLAVALAAGIPPVQVPPAPDQHGRQDRRGGAPTRQADRPGRPGSGAPAAGRAAADRRAQQWPEPASRGHHQPASQERSGNAGRIVAVVLIAIAAVVGIGAAALKLHDHKPPATVSSGSKSSSSTGPSAAPAVITPVSASGFDALNPSDKGDENSNQAANVLAGGSAQGWSTQEYYNSPYFGGLKQGTGLILDLGSAQQLSTVTVTFGSVAGADVELKVGTSSTRSAANLAAMTTVARANDVSGSYTFPITSKATGQYLVVWFTKLPPVAGSSKKYMGQIFSVVIHGAS